MQKAAKTTRFFMGLLSETGFTGLKKLAGKDGLLQNLLVNRLAHTANSRQIFSELTGKLIRFAEYYYSLRDLKSLQEASQILRSLPLADARQIGLYYQALVLKRNGSTDEAQALLETVVDNGPLAYRFRAMQTLGLIYRERNQYDDSLRLQLEVLRAASDKNDRNLLIPLMAHLEISFIKSEKGNHRSALAYLENLLPLVRLVSKQNPFYFYGYHNELAVELAELGQMAEAESALSIALASPFAAAYPEWSETRDEIASKRQSATPSTVAINRSREADPSPQPQPERESKPLIVIVSRWPASRKSYFQTSILLIAEATIFHRELTGSILDRVRYCVQSRAPPARC